MLEKTFDKRRRFVKIVFIVFFSAGVCTDSNADSVSRPKTNLDLSKIPYKIMHEKYCTTNGTYNWELFIINADGSGPVNLTNTANIDEMYTHVSPDGTKICFIADEHIKNEKVRNVYYMNIDGSDRTRVALNATQPCWSPDGRKIAFLKNEFSRYTTEPYATSELIIYDTQTGEYKLHPNKTLNHLYAVCWSPDGRWFLAAVEGATGYSDTIIAFEAGGTKVYDLATFAVRGCRPDISTDGKKLAWGETDWELCAADIDFGSDMPKVANIKKIFTCSHNMKLYHIDFSPDGKYVAFSYGPFEGGQQVGGFAKGWNICVGDLQGNWVQITTDGNHNKEPDWIPLPVENAKAEK